MHGELKLLGITMSDRTVSRILRSIPQPPSQTWRTFLKNHIGDIIAIDFFTVPTATFRILFVLIVLEHRRRQVLHFNVTEHPTAEWTGQQIVEAFVDREAPRYLIRDRDGVYGLSVDHVILGFNVKADNCLAGIEPIPADWKRRQDLTFELAEAFLNHVRRKSKRFIPIGVAQGWSPMSYAHSVQVLQSLGYTYIAFGGFVPLKTPDVLACLRAASEVKAESTVFHLLGITRCEHVQAFAKYGVVSFDSTSPLRKAFKDDKNNYYASNRTYTAIRVPQVDANPDLLRRITAGQVLQDEARKLEQRCLRLLELFDSGGASLDETIQALSEYEQLVDGWFECSFHSMVFDRCDEPIEHDEM